MEQRKNETANEKNIFIHIYDKEQKAMETK